MRAQAFPIAAIAAMLLSGCEEPQREGSGAGAARGYMLDPLTGEESMTIRRKDGPASLRAGPAVPVRLPPGFTLPAQARVTRVAHVARPGGEGVLIRFESDGPAADTLAHVRAEAVAAGFAITAELDTETAQTLVAERRSDGTKIVLDLTAGSPPAGQLVIVAPGR